MFEAELGVCWSISPRRLELLRRGWAGILVAAVFSTSPCCKRGPCLVHELLGVVEDGGGCGSVDFAHFSPA